MSARSKAKHKHDNLKVFMFALLRNIMKMDQTAGALQLICGMKLRANHQEYFIIRTNLLRSTFCKNDYSD